MATNANQNSGSAKRRRLDSQPTLPTLQLLIDNREKGYILTPRLVIEIPVGQDNVYMGYGDGIAITSVSGGYRIGNLNILGDFGFQIPFSTKKQSTSMLYHLHLSYSLFKYFVRY